jgi:hypothetical protein
LAGNLDERESAPDETLVKAKQQLGAHLKQWKNFKAVNYKSALKEFFIDYKLTECKIQLKLIF